MAMKLSKQLHKKVEDLANSVRNDFRSRGIVIPMKEDNGIINLDGFFVVRNKNGFYSILNKVKTAIVENINLPQTAVLVANKLALGRSVDDRLIAQDTQYGYNAFEEEQCKRIASKMAKQNDWERFDSLVVKQGIAHLKAEYAKKNIISSFEKLRQLR